jgi:DNA polymerase-3 subunit epsilon
VACYVVVSRTSFVPLYARAAARPKRALSDKQRVALEKATAARQALRTCTGCVRVVGSKYRLLDVGEEGRLCLSCYAAFEQRKRQPRLYTWAHNTLAASLPPLRVLDTEMTGLSSAAEVVEVAVLDQDGAVLLNTRIRPQGRLTPGAAALTGLTDAELATAPRLPEVWQQLADILSGTRIVAYNADVDRLMLGQTAARYKLKLPPAQWLCLMEACTVMSVDGETWLSLATVASELGAPLPSHRALGDAQTALHVLRLLAERHHHAARSPDLDPDPHEETQHAPGDVYFPQQREHTF